MSRNAVPTNNRLTPLTKVRLYSVTNVGFRLFVLQTFIFLGCLVSFVLKILYLFLYAIFKVHVRCFCIFYYGLLPKPMGLSGLEPPTSRLSGVRSNRLSYKPFPGIRQPPALPCRLQHSTIGRLGLNHRVRDGNGCVP